MREVLKYLRNNGAMLNESRLRETLERWKSELEPMEQDEYVCGRCNRVLKEIEEVLK